MRATDLANQTPYILPDEMTLGLQEVELQTPDGKAVHRYQIVYVVRQDRASKYVVDLGDRIKFPNPPLNIIVNLEHSVAEVQDMATEARGRSSVTKRLAELQEESTKDRNIIKAYLEQKEINSKVIANKSHYGPTTSIQRIGFHGNRSS